MSDNCLLRGCRVVVPEQGRRLVLTKLRLGHPGISRIRGLGRSLVWWPGFDKAVDMFVKNCPECHLHEKTPPNAPLHPWEWLSRPFYNSKWSVSHHDHFLA